MFFANIWSIYDKYLKEIFFLYSFDSFAPAKSKIIKFESKLSKIWAITFQNFWNL